MYEDALCNSPCGEEPLGCSTCEDAGNFSEPLTDEEIYELRQANRIGGWRI
jgi:hypothetical protein